jgi:hypothetical protein
MFIVNCFTVFFKILYYTSYVAMQALPFYFLWRVRWLRRQLRSITQPPHPDHPSDILYPGFENFRDVLKAESRKWDNDTWSVGQIVTLSLWFPALLEMVYIFFGMSILTLSLVLGDSNIGDSWTKTWTYSPVAFSLGGGEI